jgi:hypothetical protein
VGSVGCRTLIRHLHHENEALTDLDLSDNRLDDSACIEGLYFSNAKEISLGEVLERNRALQTLSISMNLISIHGMERLVRALKTNTESAISVVNVSAQEHPGICSALEATRSRVEASHIAWDFPARVLDRFVGLEVPERPSPLERSASSAHGAPLRRDSFTSPPGVDAEDEPQDYITEFAEWSGNRDDVSWLASLMSAQSSSSRLNLDRRETFERAHGILRKHPQLDQDKMWQIIEDALKGQKGGP